MTDLHRLAALDYHANPRPGKIATALTKPLLTQADLSLAYTPGVAAPVTAIAGTPALAYQYTNKGNLVAVITNGTAVLGLGDTGPLAAKPVMEGKAALFKLYADIDVFDLELDCRDPQQLIEIIAALAPTFGGINLEDIKAPECFAVTEALKARLNIPVLHDDQEGTAIVIAAALLNALALQQKTLAQVKIVCLGAGAAGIATLNLLCKLGAQQNNIVVVDRGGIVHTDRTDLNEAKRRFAICTQDRSLPQALMDADVFIGVSGPNLLAAEYLNHMAERPIIFALSNPVPEIMPDLIKAIRPDSIIATGRSDYPNQVNNVLCFPYLFRGALDARAHSINEAMQLAATSAIQALAQQPIPQEVLAAYQLKHLAFGPNYILPKPNDPRLRDFVSTAVREAAIKSGAINFK